MTHTGTIPELDAILDAPLERVTDLIVELRESRALSRVMIALNAMVLDGDDDERGKADAALRRLGFVAT